MRCFQTMVLEFRGQSMAFTNMYRCNWSDCDKSINKQLDSVGFCVHIIYLPI
jgi:hypothetical protein